ncbi:failed axon connections homolog isoform X2 [Gigantopelta aegis]|uniref:failed axon connections homolog isoform X2 n=1 Tax=Gigantopelta aegis TaxID=1735272 RepID=UPI001B88DF0B|nr:failed axon connections homolog isoform X2 [Gigantopelta aegis]
MSKQSIKRKFIPGLFMSPWDVFSVASREANPRDLVILRQIGRGLYAPSMSPFPLKLETYLRMAKIPYQSVHSFKMSSKGKTPWIQYNDDDVADSAFCVDYLNDKFGVDLNANLNCQERAVARAFEKMVEEGTLFWSLVLYRWVYPVDRSLMLKVFGFSSYWMWVMVSYVRNMAWAQGSGRHSQQEVDHILEGDLRAVSDLLGDKMFIFGDTPSEVDCSLFGFLSQYRYNMCGLKPEQIIETFPNLGKYCDRIQSLYWPDWDDKITHGEYSGIGPYTVIKEEIFRP